MSLNGHRSVSVALELIHLSTLPDDLDRLHCLHCRSDIAIHQPDESSPERMLGVCKACKYWFLMDRVPGTSEAILVLLPDGGHFRHVLDGRST
jgi:hypothetical protein